MKSGVLGLGLPHLTLVSGNVRVATTHSWAGGVSSYKGERMREESGGVRI
jgi:hypothetical protein